MYSSSSGDAPTATTTLNNRDTAFSIPSDLSGCVWERQSLGKDKFDRERYTSTKRDWTVDNRSSSYRSSGVLSASGSLFNKRRAIGRHETGVENGRHRSAVGRSSDPSTFLRSPSQIGKGERDVCSPGHVGSPNRERPNKAIDGHYHRDTHVSPSTDRPLSSPRFDSRLHGNQNDSEVPGPWDRGRTRFNSPPYTWDAPSRDRDYRERAWSRPDYRRAYPLPKLDSSREWSQSDRELLEGRIDRYSSVSGREAGFTDVLSTNSRERNRHELRGRDRVFQSGISSAYPPTSNLYIRDSKHAPLALEASGAVSPPQHSPMQSSFSHESDQDCGPSISKKRPRLTWGQGLAKYEKEKTGEDFLVVKKAEEGTNCGGGLHFDGSVNSVLPQASLQTANGLSLLDERHPSEEQMRNSDRGGWHAEPAQASCQESVVYPSKKDTREAQADGHADHRSNIVKTGENDASEASHDTSFSQSSVFRFMQDFLNRYQQELPDISKEILTQYVEKVEFEIDWLEKEIMKIGNEQDKDTMVPEMKLDESLHVSYPDNGTIHVENFSDSPVSSAAITVSAGEFGASGLPGDAVHAVSSADKGEVMELCAHEVVQESMIGITEQEVEPAASMVCLTAPPRAVNWEGVSAKFEMSRAFGVDLKDPISSIVLSNRKTAEKSSSALAHLLQGRGDTCVGGLHEGKLQESHAWKHRAEKHGKIRNLLQVKVFEAKSLVKFTEGVLAVKYMAKREAWKQDQNGNIANKDRDNCVSTWDPEKLSPSRHSPLQMCPVLSTSLLVPESPTIELQVAKRLLAESPLHRKRHYMKMPPMVLCQKERDAHVFQSMNAVVEDPEAAERERKAVNPWSEEERRIFLDKYSLLGKNLRKIASFLEHKTVADCVQFFYLNQKTEEFEKIHRRHQLKKRRECRASALYLATTTSASSRHREANAAYVEGLSLVASAAAAMSAPREFSRSARSPALKPGPLGSSSSKSCRESHLMKQTSWASTLSVKDSNVEHLGGKCAQNTHSRCLKRPHEEVLQWRSQWNDTERDLFLKAVTMYGKDFERISAFIGSKSLGQCKTYFSKARKRLGLDQLVERHMALLESKKEGENSQREVQDKEVELPIPGLEVEMGGDSFEQEVKVKPSPHCVNSCMASEVRCNSPRDNQEVISALSCPKTMQVMDQTGSVLLSGNVSLPNVDSSLDHWPCSPFHVKSHNVDACGSAPRVGVSPTTAVQGCFNESEEALEIKAEPMNVNADTVLVSQMSIGASNLSPSCIYGSSPSTVASALVPSSFAQSAMVQVPQGKEKNAKASEVKARREPTSWTQEEKEKFVEVLKVHGKNWDLLCKSLPAKSLIQIKTYFQNSKAKLGLGSDGTVNNSGRAGSSWKRKVDDSDSSTNAGSAGQILSQKACVSSDEGGLKSSPSILAQSGGQGSNILSAEALAYANIFGRKLLEDSINAQKAFHAMGLTQNTSSPGILPMLSSPVFSQPNLASTQQPYTHNATATMKIPHIMGHQQPEQSLASMMVVEPSSSVNIHQTHLLPPQQQVAEACQDFSLQSVQKQPPQIDQKNLLQLVPSQNQQLQQMAEAVLQQLLPQAVQRHQQQLQLAAQQVHHQFQQPPSHLQAPINWQVQSQGSAGSVPVSVVACQQKQQPQPHQPHHTHGKLQALLQQHQHIPQLNQLQLLQLHRQQQQLLLHMQQSQALSQSQQIQNQTLHAQQSLNLSNEQQQQQPPFFRGFTQLSCSSGEASKQSDFDIQTFNKLQQCASGDSCQPFTSNQPVEAPSKSQFVPEYYSAGDVKLFGQSLLLQPASGNQHLHAKILPSSSALASASDLPGGIAAVTVSSNMPTQLSWDYGFQGQGGLLVTRPNASSNGSSCIVVSGKGDNEMASCVQEPPPGSNEMQLRDTNGGRVADTKHLPHVLHLPDSKRVSSERISLDNCSPLNSTDMSCGPSGAILRCDSDNEQSKSGMVGNLDQVTNQAGNLDHGTTLNMDRKPDPGCIVVSGGGEAQGLPRVLDALVALAEWRLQNSKGCSGKLTDEFLSQSWEALQRDPGSLIQAGKASSLTKLCSEGPEMLHHLRERLLSSHSGCMTVGSSGAGSAAGPTLEGTALSNDKQIVSSEAVQPQSTEEDPASADPAGSEFEKLETDGS